MDVRLTDGSFAGLHGGRDRDSAAACACAWRWSAPAPDELQELLLHGLQKAGAVKLMTPELIATLADHAQGNPRALMTIAGELLAVAAQREARHIDEKLFLETCAPPAAEIKAASARRR
jgi:general secretion pathway protein A